MIHSSCCIAGGGPAGMMLGFLLARAGIDVMVLEKHADFLRDFRGDTIHPSTLELMHELGILDDFLQKPHQEVRELGGQIGDEFVILADFSHLPTHCKFIALMPQWDFLDFLAEHARRYPNFQLKMRTEVIDLLQDAGEIIGVRAKTPEGIVDIRADLIVGADGRHSIVREKAGLPVDELGAPMDVLWFRVSRRTVDGGQTLGRISRGKMMVMLNRDDYWQCAYLIRKGDLDRIKQAGLPAFQSDVVSVVPFLRDRMNELRTWITQAVQVFIQNRLIRRILGANDQIRMPWPLKLLKWWPALRRVPARLVGMGFRSEHVRV